MSSRGGVSRTEASVKAACGVADELVCTVSGGLKGAGGLASGCLVAGVVPSHGEFLLFWREWYQSRSRFLFRWIALANLSIERRVLVLRRFRSL